MAGLNVAEWSPEQVSEWLSGLGPAVQPYVAGLRARGLAGTKLLMLRCDDLEYLGVHVIGHQELILEAVEHLRNFQYELSRECIQQLALRVSVVATSLARQLRAQPEARLDTQTLADVARTVHAVKPLVCWLDRWPTGGTGVAGGLGAALAERRVALLKLALEAATCAQRDRFAEQPARAVAAAAAATAAVADYIIQEVCDPLVVTPAMLLGACVRLRGRSLGFSVEPSHTGHNQLTDIRFGSPAHASGAVHQGDEIVQVCGQCVVGWSASAVLAACIAAGAGGELTLRLRRRAARPPPRAPHVPSRTLYLPTLIHRYRTRSILSAEVKETPVSETPESLSSSSDSEPLSPPSSPTRPLLDHTRIYPPKPRALVQRRYTISCSSPINKRPNHTMEQFWQQLKEQRRSAGIVADTDDVTLYARDKAVSYSTGLETARPRTCLGIAQASSPPSPPPPPTPPPALAAVVVPPATHLPAPPSEEERLRGKLDKSHSTPAYDFAAAGPEPEPTTHTHPPIPESPPASSDVTSNEAPTLHVHSAEKADQIQEFKKSSSQIGEAMLLRRNTDDHLLLTSEVVGGSGPRDVSTTEMILETINIAMMEHRRRSVLDNDDRPPSSRCRSARRSVAPSSPVGSIGGGGGVASGSVGGRTPGVEALGILRAIPRTSSTSRDQTSPLKPHRPIDAAQISVPLRHITKHDIRMIPSEPRHDLPAINAEPYGPQPPSSAPATAPTPPATPGSGDIVVGAQADSKGALSPTSAVRGMFPTSKSRSLKKKSSILAKRRSVPYRALAARGAAGGVWQRVRARHPSATPRWARRHLLLAHNLLYAYRTPECSKADCMIYLEGFTAATAGEVKSRAHAFKVYHTGTAFYFACDSREAMHAWIQLIHRATLLPSLRSHVDTTTHFSETDYSETESDNESPEKRSERDRDRDRDKDKDKDKDKSKFGSLKKLTGRMQRSESQEHVGHATSLDRKYLRFFSRNKSKDDSKPKNKQSGVPVPTEHYRSYRRVDPPPSSSPSSPPRVAPSPAPPAELRASRKMPKPINYIHASNPNLLDFEKSDFVTKPALQPPKPNVSKVLDHSVGLVTLEQFMLQKQAEERRQLVAYSDRVLLGVQAEARRALDTIVADVIYGEVGAPHSSGKPISVKGKDGYEKIVYPDESPSDPSHQPPGYQSVPDSPPPLPAPAPAPRPAPTPALSAALQTERWRDSLRRNDKVHTRTDSSPASKSTSQISQNSTSSNDNWNNNGSETASGPGVSRLRLMFGGGRTHQTQSSPVSPLSGGGGGGGPRTQYPHLQCPPVFHPETYSLSRARRPRPDL